MTDPRAYDAGERILLKALEIAINMAETIPPDETSLIPEAVVWAFGQCDPDDDRETIEAAAMARLEDPEFIAEMEDRI